VAKGARLGGVYTAVVTPFDSHLNVDTGWMRRHLLFQQQAGVDGVVVCGTNGEGHALSLAERRSIVEHAARHKGRMRLIAGGGFPALPDAVEFSRICSGCGVDALLVFPPHFTRQTDEAGLAGWYAYLADRTRLPIILYHIPQFTGVPITPGLIRRLSQHGNIAGVKDSSGNVPGTETFAREFPKMELFVGSDSHILQSLQAGATGVISGIANVFPKEVVDIWRTFRRGEDAFQTQTLVTALDTLFDGLPARAATKYALHLLGMPATHIRPPELELTKEQKILLTRRLA